VRPSLIPALAFAACIAMLFVPPIHQDAACHSFADQRTIPPLAMLLLLRGLRDPLIPMMLFYALAKILEWQDQTIAAVISTGGHPWKHVAAAAAVFFYVRALEGQATVKRWPAPHGNQNVNLAAS